VVPEPYNREAYAGARGRWPTGEAYTVGKLHHAYRRTKSSNAAGELAEEAKEHKTSGNS